MNPASNTKATYACSLDAMQEQDSLAFVAVLSYNWQIFYILPNFTSTEVHILWQTVEMDRLPKADLYSF